MSVRRGMVTVKPRCPTVPLTKACTKTASDTDTAHTGNAAITPQFLENIVSP